MGKSQPTRPVLFHSGSFVALETALWRELGAVREREPLAPVVVLVPTNLLRRHLAAQAAEQGGCLNVFFMTIIDLAREVGGPALAAAGRLPLPRAGDELIARAVCRATPGGYFAAIAERPGFHSALLGTLQDFKEAGHTPADSRAGRGTKLSDLEALWAAYEARLKELKLYDNSDLLSAAASAASSDRWLGQVAALLVYGFYDLNEVQRRLVAACAQGRTARAFFPFRRGSEAFAYARPTLDWFAAQGFEAMEEPEPELPADLAALQSRLFERPKGAPAAGDRVRIVSAPDEMREVKAVVRSALAAAKEGTALPRVGVLLRQTGTYGPLFAEECEAGGLGAYHHDARPLSASRAGRSLLMLLRLIGSDLARSDVMDFVTYADIPHDASHSTADWDLLSIQAGVVKGIESWQRRLAARRRGLQTEAKDNGQNAGELLAALDAFQAFLGRFLPALDRVPKRGTWTQLVDALLGVFDEFTREGDEREAVAEAVGELRALDATGEAADITTLSRLARETLEGHRPRRPAFGSCGPVVVDLMEGRGLPFDVVCVPGLVEKGFPGLPGQDPLLGDEERRRLNECGLRLPLKGRRAEEERLLLRLAVGAASQRVVLSYPRLEASGRERVPSHFLLRAVEAVTGARCDYSGIAEFPGFSALPASAFAPERPEDCWREAEYDLAVVRQAVASHHGAEAGYLASVSATFAAAFRAEAARWGGKRFTEYDGVLSAASLPALEKRLGPAPWRVRATDLERYAACPFRYFVEHVLGIQMLEEPEAVQRLSGIDRGRLMHAILQRALRRARDEHALPIRPEHEERVLAAARESFEEFEQEGLVGLPALWEIERGALEFDLRRFVLDEAADEAAYLPAHFEASFGTRPREGEDELHSDEGLLLDLGETGTLRVVGRIDRIDLTPDQSRGRVIDYKTGLKQGKPKDNSLSGGKTLQLPLYLKAAEALIGAAFDVALYRYITDRGGYGRSEFTREALDERGDDLRAVLTAIVAGIRGGCFFAGLAAGPCGQCDFYAICGAAAGANARRKGDDPAAQRYQEMRDIE